MPQAPCSASRCLPSKYIYISTPHSPPHIHTSPFVIKPSPVILFVLNYHRNELLVMHCLILASNCTSLVFSPSSPVFLISAKSGVSVNLQMGSIGTEDEITKTATFGKATSWILLTLAMTMKRRRKK